MRASIRICTALPLLAMAGIPALFATDYYVSPSGNDRSNGRNPSAAWATLAKVTRTNFSPGDHIWLQGGATFDGMLYLDGNDAGTPSNPVTVGSYGSGQAIINAGSGMGIFVYNAAGFRISNVRVVGSGYPYNNTAGILFYNELPGNTKLDTVQIDGVDVSGFGKFGIWVLSWNGKSGYRNVAIANSSVHDNGDGGLNVSGYFDPALSGYSHENVYIGHVRSYRNLGIPGTSYGSGMGILVSDINGGTIERCVASYNGERNTSNGGPEGIMVWDANAITVQHNESHHNRTSSVVDGGGFDLDGGTTNSVLQYNYSHDNDGGGFLLAQFYGARPHARNVIRYNISQNDGRKNGAGGIHLWNGGSGISDTDIYNNTVYITPGTRNTAALVLGSSTINTRVRNNIFLAAGGSMAEWAEPGQYGLVMQGNLYWAYGTVTMLGIENRIYYDLGTFRAATGLERVGAVDAGIIADPQLAAAGAGGTFDNADLLSGLSAYRTMAGSPAIDAGLNLAALSGTAVGAFDFFGGAALQGTAFDIGAAETAR